MFLYVFLCVDRRADDEVEAARERSAGLRDEVGADGGSQRFR